MDARSSGDKLVFIHGCGLSLIFAGDCAAAVCRRLRVEIRKKKSRVYFKYTCERRRMIRPPVVSKIVIVAGVRNFASDFGTSSGNANRARAGAEKGRRVLHWRGEDCPGADQSYSCRLSRQRRQDGGLCQPCPVRRGGPDHVSRAFGVRLSAPGSGRTTFV